MKNGRRFSYLIGALIFLSVFTAPAHAGVCSDFLLASKNYFSQVRESKGLRLLVAPSEGEEPRERFYGFVSPRGWPAPFSGLNNVLVEKPTNALVKAFAGPKKKASFLVKVPVIVGWVLLAQFYVIDPVTDHAMQSRIQSEIAENKVAFDQLIQNDYRFEPIRFELSAGRITPEEAEQQAYMVSRAYSSYYSHRDGKKGQFTDEENAGLLDHYLFGHLKAALTSEIEVPPGFAKGSGFNSRASEDQSRRLFKLTHALYLRYQIIDASSHNAPPELAEFIGAMKADPFYKQLDALRIEKKVSNTRFQRALQEHAFWDYRLRSYEVLGLVKMNPETGQPVTLADLDAEILAEAQQ